MKKNRTENVKETKLLKDFQIGKREICFKTFKQLQREKLQLTTGKILASRRVRKVQAELG